MEQMDSKDNSLNIDNQNLATSINLAPCEEHHIDPCFLDIEVEKKLLDTFFHRLESDRTPIKLNHYDVQSAETCKSLGASIKKRVLTESESTDENLGEDLSVALKYVELRKVKYNKLFSTKTEDALDGYLKLDRQIDETLMNIRDPKICETQEYKKILDEKTKICSNIAGCYEKFKDFRNAVKYCNISISMDPNFDKCYAKKIKCFLSMTPADVSAAEQVKKEMEKFTEDTRNKYADIFKLLESKVTENDNEMRKRLKENMKKQELARQEAERAAQAAQNKQKAEESKPKENNEEAIQVKAEGKLKQNKGLNLFGMIFGGLFFVTSSASLFLLYKFRKTFTK